MDLRARARPLEQDRSAVAALVQVGHEQLGRRDWRRRRKRAAVEHLYDIDVAPALMRRVVEMILPALHRLLKPLANNAVIFLKCLSCVGPATKRVDIVRVVLLSVRVCSVALVLLLLSAIRDRDEAVNGRGTGEIERSELGGCLCAPLLCLCPSFSVDKARVARLPLIVQPGVVVRVVRVLSQPLEPKSVPAGRSTLDRELLSAGK